MSLKYRVRNGAPLTWGEVDENFRTLDLEKVSVRAGYGLSQENFTTTEKQKIDSLPPNLEFRLEQAEDNAADAATDAAAANQKASIVLAPDEASKGPGAIPFDDQLDYPEGTAGAAIKAGGSQAADILRQDIEADNGSEIVGFGQTNVFDSINAIGVNPKKYGAKGDNLTDDYQAIMDAISEIRANGGGVLDLGSSGKTNYRVSRPIKLTFNLVITGNARILPTANFLSNVVFPTFGTEVPQTYACLAYYNEGTHADDPNNWGRSGLSIDETVIFDGQYHQDCPVGFIAEGITNYRIDAQFVHFESTGPWMKYYCWVGSIGSYITNCRSSFAKLGPASNGINLSGFKGYGQSDTPDYGLIIEGDNNGIDLSGAVIEKTKNHILWTGGSGPSTVSGVDFEICSGTAIHVDGSSVTGRPAGPIIIIGSFLEAGAVAVKATNAIVIVEGCRIRSTPLAFKAVGTQAAIYERGNVIESSVTKVSEGNFCSDHFDTSSQSIKTRVPWGDTSVKTGYTHEVFAYSYNEGLPTTIRSDSAQLADPSTQRMLTSSSWVTREMRNGVVFGEMGLVLDYLAGIKRVIPKTASDTSLGSVQFPFSRTYSQVVVQCPGVANSVNPQNPGEIVMQFTTNSQITIKAMGSDGVVRSGNIAIS